MANDIFNLHRLGAIQPRPQGHANASPVFGRYPPRPGGIVAATHSIYVNATPRKSTERQPRAGLCRPHRIQELADLELEAVAVARQRLRRRENLRGGRAALTGAAVHLAAVGGERLGARGRLVPAVGGFVW